MTWSTWVIVGALLLIAQDGTSPAPLPKLDCVIDYGNQRFAAVFRYENSSGRPLIVEPGAENYLDPPVADADLPGIFRPIASNGIPDVRFEVPLTGETLTWVLKDQSATANADSPACEIEHPVRLQVYPDDHRQTISGFGGAYVFRFSKTMDKGLTDQVAEITYDTFAPTHMRFEIPLDLWESTNDNDDPLHIDFDGFTINERMEATFDYMLRGQADGALIHASVWNAPDWMVENPETSRHRIVPAENYDELVESLLAYLLYARDERGINIDTVSFNEPDIGVFVEYTPDELVDIMLRSASRFEEADLSTRWALAETSNMANALENARAMWENQSVHPYVQAWAYHSWDAAGEGTLRENSEWAESVGLQTWITEVGYDPQLYFTPEEFETWDNALQLAAVYSKLYKASGMNVPFYWEMIDDYRLLSADGSRYFPAFTFLRLLRETLPVGSIITESGPDIVGVHYFAVVLPDDGMTLMIVNISPQSTGVEVEGMLQGQYAHYRLSETEELAHIGAFLIADDNPRFFLPGESITFITTLTSIE